MFILYALIVGVLLGALAGGNLAGLAELRLRWSWLFIAGLGVQVVLFSDQVAERIGSLGAPIYVASTSVVVGAVLANRTIPGMAVVAGGAISNLIAIVGNGGYMPASPGALAALGMSPATIYSNSSVVEDPAFAPLTDIFALPSWLPWHNIFSVGDVLIGAGVVVVVVAAMRSGARRRASVGAR